MNQIVDTRVRLFADSGEAASTLLPDVLVAYMDGPFLVAGELRHVDQALIAPHRPPTSDGRPSSPGKLHASLMEACRCYPDRLYGSFSYEPTDGPECALPELERLATEQGFRSVTLDLAISGMEPRHARDSVWPILASACRLDLAVVIHVGEPPLAYPTEIEALVEAFPDLRIVLAHSGAPRPVLADEAWGVAATYDNVWVETSYADLPNLKQGIRALGAGRLLFGSDAPLNDMWSRLRPIEVLCHKPPFGINLSEPDRERILGGNAVEVFRL